MPLNWRVGGNSPEKNWANWPDAWLRQKTLRKPIDCKKTLCVDFTATNLMPKILRQKLPEALLRHLLTRMRQRAVSHEQIVQLARWLDANPEVPEGKWFKKFPGLTVCGEGELIKTFLQPGQAATGKEIN